MAWKYYRMMCISQSFFFVHKEVRMTKLILQKNGRIKYFVWLATNSTGFEFPPWNNIHILLFRKRLPKQNPAGDLTKHVSLKLKWCCLEITRHKNECQKINVEVGIYKNSKDFPIKMMNKKFFICPEKRIKVKCISAARAIKESII